jgi:hypothetical protein
MSDKPGSHFPFHWRKSSHSADQGNCVEVATLTACVLVRDSKKHNSPVVKMTSAEWESFLARVRK